MTDLLCICGHNQSKAKQVKFFEVTKEGETVQAKNGKKMELAECSSCGLLFQPIKMNGDDYVEYYKNYQPTSSKYKAKDYKHDRKVAALRCDNYGLTIGCDKHILDIGSGSGAFVDECRERGATAYGCEITKYANQKSDDFIYRKQFEDVHFPTDNFDIITCHDVLEHSLDPKGFLAEAFRAVKQGGTFILDFPNYFVKEGKHHWKKEHVWYFDIDYLRRLLGDIGFVTLNVSNPIQSKIVIKCIKPVQDRKKVLLPPGIGDTYWSIIKLQSFIEKNNIGVPDVLIAHPKSKKHNGHLRAFPFIEMFPFLKSSWEVKDTIDDGKRRALWKEAYAKRGRTIFHNVLDCDYFVSYNGHLRYGEQMEQIDPDLVTDWNPPRFISIEEEKFKEYCQNKFGKYIVFYFIFGGTYCHWTREFPVERIIGLIKKTVAKTGCTPVFTGAVWDEEDGNLNKLKREFPDAVDMVGETTVGQLFGMLRGSECVVGYPSGLSIMSAAFGINTVIIWNDFYDKDFAWHCVDPKVRNKTYFVENTKNIDIRDLSVKIANIIEGKPEVSTMPLPDVNAPATETQEPQKTIKVRRALKESAIKLRENNQLTIACVLKSGGEYDELYVKNMYGMLQRKININFDFKVLTDMDVNIEGVETIKLEKDFPGWWSKLELFQLKGPVLYFDLDTVICKKIDRFAFHVSNLPNDSFYMLTPFNPSRKRAGKWASGVMAWNGDFRYIIDEFDKKTFKGWDQIYISNKLTQNNINIQPINQFSNIKSFKRHCKNNMPPDNAEIICFHGRQRPHSTNLQWVQEAWK